MMDHRLGRRRSISIPVRLEFRDGTSGWGIATDIGQGGLFVKTVASPRRAVNGCLDVSMTVAMPGGERSVRLPAAIVHASECGFGAMFRAIDRGAERVVAWLLGMEDPAARFAAMAARPAPALVPAKIPEPPAASPRRRVGVGG